MGWIPIRLAAELRDGDMVAVDLDDRDILIARVGDDYYAIDNICTHAWGMLDQGSLHGCEVQCPLHSGRFDLRTGEATRPPATAPVATYPIQVEGHTLLVLLEEADQARSS